MKMKKLYKSLFFYLALLAFLPVGFSIPARGETVTDYDRFQLWNDCKPINLSVATQSADAKKIRLSTESVETMVRSRLRAARIYDEDSDPYLSVAVIISGAGFSVDIGLRKIVLDSASAILNFATTWESGSTGTHGWDASYIMSDVSQKTDKFIDQYLRVNQSACK